MSSKCRTVETFLAWFTLGALIIYVPGETYVSWSDGLLHPFYLVDFIAMVLMFWGAVHSLRSRPLPSPGLLCGAYGWTTANGWRATFWRLYELRDGGTLDYGTGEAWVVGCATAVAVGIFIVLLALTSLTVGAQRH